MANGAETAAPLLEARHISKLIDAITALNDANFAWIQVRSWASLATTAQAKSRWLC